MRPGRTRKFMKHEGTRKDPRCKRCGRLTKSDEIAKGKHGHRVKVSTQAYCTVATEEYMPGFPLDGYHVSE